MFPKIWELERFQTPKVTFKVTQSHNCWCNLIGHIYFLLVFRCNYDYIVPFPRFRDIVSISQKLKMLRDAELTPFENSDVNLHTKFEVLSFSGFQRCDRAP